MASSCELEGLPSEPYCESHGCNVVLQGAAIYACPWGKRAWSTVWHVSRAAQAYDRRLKAILETLDAAGYEIIELSTGTRYQRLQDIEVT